MNDTDAGDYAIGQSHPVSAAPERAQPKAALQTFSAPLKLQVSPFPSAYSLRRPTDSVYSQPFLSLFKNAKGAAAADLIVKATAAPGVYVFGELLQLPALQAVRPASIAVVRSLIDRDIAEIAAAIRTPTQSHQSLRIRHLDRLHWFVVAPRIISSRLIPSRSARPTDFPTLTKQQETKLKQLTIVTLARDNRVSLPHPFSALLCRN